MNGWALSWFVQGGLAVGSVAAGRPFTSWFSNRRYPREITALPVFRETNSVLAVAWSIIFIAAGLIDLWFDKPWVNVALVLATIALTPVTFKAGERYAAWRLRPDLDRALIVSGPDANQSVDRG